MFGDIRKKYRDFKENQLENLRPKNTHILTAEEIERKQILYATKKILLNNPLIIYENMNDYLKNKKQAIKNISYFSLIPDSAFMLSGFYLSIFLYGKFTGVSKNFKILRNYSNNVFGRYFLLPLSVFFVYRQKHFTEKYFKKQFKEEMDIVQEYNLHKKFYLYDYSYIHEKILDLYIKNEIPAQYVEKSPHFKEFIQQKKIEKWTQGTKETKIKRQQKQKQQQQQQQNREEMQNNGDNFQSQDLKNQRKQEKQQRLLQEFKNQADSSNFYFEVQDLIDGGIDDEFVY